MEAIDNRLTKSTGDKLQSQEMGVVQELNVVLDNAHEVVEAGGKIKGTVRLKLSESIKTKGIFLTLRGINDVSFGVSEAGMHEHDRCCKTSNVFLSNVSRLFPEPSVTSTANDSMFDLTKGAYSYGFELDMPSASPPSLELPEGHIRYSVKCVLERKNRNERRVCKKFFTVSCCADLNDNTKAGNAVEISEGRAETLCSILDQGKIHLSLKLPRCGYVPGECLTFSAEIDNKTRTKLSTVAFQLVQVTGFRAQSERHFREDAILTVYGSPILAHRREIWRSVTPKIPPVVPSGEHGDLISVRYYVKLCVNRKQLFQESKFDLSTDIYIGTLPLRATEGRRLGQELNNNPLIQYEESIFGSSKVGQVYSSMRLKKTPIRFTPKYAMYNFDSKK